MGNSLRILVLHGVEHLEPFESEAVTLGQSVGVFLQLEDQSHDFAAVVMGEPRESIENVGLAHT